MEKEGTPRSKLIGMKVYNPDGTFVGTVNDLSIDMASGSMGLLITSKHQTELGIPWSKIQAAGDIMILKETIKVEVPAAAAAPVVPAAAAAPVVPAAAAAPVVPAAAAPYAQASSATIEEEKKKPGLLGKIRPKHEKELCLTCGQPLTYIKEYARWYCYNCGKYA